jgi:phosphatidylglycerophosphatase A
MHTQKSEPFLLDRVSLFLATGLFVSYLPSGLLHAFKHRRNSRALIDRKWTGAGFMGSVEGALMYLILPARIAVAWPAVGIGFGAAVYFSGRAEKVLNSHDDSRIVIDEWIGAWIAVWGLPQHISMAFLAAFVLFRFFDVLKGPIGHACQRLPGGWGITLDDVYAGVFANICWRIGVKTLMLSVSH